MLKNWYYQWWNLSNIDSNSNSNTGSDINLNEVLTSEQSSSDKLNKSNKSDISNQTQNNDEGALSDNEIEKEEVSKIIESEVDKLTVENLDDNGLKIEELNFDIDDLSQLEEVYHDEPSSSNSELNLNNIDDVSNKSNKSDTSPIINNSTLNTSNHNDEPNIKLNVSEKETLSNLNNQIEEESPPVKTIIIDTKKGSSKMVTENSLEINDFEDDEGSDTDDDSIARKKIYNRYSKKRDYSFFN